MTGSEAVEQAETVELALKSARVAAAVPQRVLIVPWGRVESSAGVFVVDEESARAAVEAFERHGTDLPIDYEHQSLGGRWSAPSGQAPAAGWIKSLEARSGVGIFATVEWTEPARRQIAARQYRYLSPVAVVAKSDRRLVALHSVGLTNKPAIVGMEPIVNSEDMDTQTRRDCREGGMQEQIEKLRTVLQLDQQPEPEQVLVAAGERIEQLTDQLTRREAAEVVGRAMRSGKLTEAQREWAVELALSDRAAYEQWEATAPVVVPAGRTSGPTEAARGEPGRAAVIASARAEFRQHPELAMLTDERDYINDSLRQRELELLTD